MKNIKKIFEKDGFYLALFACVCMVAIGGIWVTNSNVSKLADQELDKDKEIELVEDDKKKDDSVAVNSETGENLESAKKEIEEDDDDNKTNEAAKEVAKEEKKEVNFSALGKNAKSLTYEAREGVDGKSYKMLNDLSGHITANKTMVAINNNTEIKSIIDGTISKIESNSITIKSEDNKTVLVYSGLGDFKVSKGDKVKSGDTLGLAKTKVSEEQVSGFKGGSIQAQVIIEATKDNKGIDPDTLLK